MKAGAATMRVSEAMRGISLQYDHKAMPHWIWVLENMETDHIFQKCLYTIFVNIFENTIQFN